MALRDTPAFDQFGYWPNTPSQWREPTVDDCTWYSGEFAFQAADEYRRNFHPVNDIRNQSTDRVGGTPVDVMLRDMADFWPKDAGLDYKYGAWPKRDIRRALWTGATVVVGGDYEKLPLHYRRWTNNDYFNHAMAVRFLRTRKDGTQVTALYDPLGGGPTRQPYDGEWIAFNAIFGDEDEYTWRAQAGRYWVGVVDNLHRKEQMKKVFFDAADSTREARVQSGTPVFSEPSTVAPRLKVLMDDTKWYKLIGRVNPNWFAIFSWNKELKDHEVGYVAASDIKAMQNRQPQENTDEAAIITLLTDEKNALLQELKELNDRREALASIWAQVSDVVENMIR